MTHDIRYALRGFCLYPGFALAVVMVIALGIGASTAVFSVVDRILFRALPYSHGDRLVTVGFRAPIVPEEFFFGAQYLDFRDDALCRFWLRRERVRSVFAWRWAPPLVISRGWC